MGYKETNVCNGYPKKRWENDQEMLWTLCRIKNSTVLPNKVGKS